MAQNLKINNADLSNAIRMLSVDAVEKANSGHPGMPMGMADVATVLFTKFLKFDATDPNWMNRDRFVLSAGHGSMLLYSLLYLNGYKDISIEDIKNFNEIEKISKYVDVIINFAAETHVDRSIANPKPFIETNILGTYSLLESSRKHNKKFIHI